jgi:hypothetical protein
MKKLSFLFVFLLMSNVFISCSANDDGPVNEEEVITTLIATFVPEDGGETVVLTYRDLEDGNPAFLPAVGIFEVGKTYTATLSLLNELVNPVENITEEIEEEGDKHQFFFSASQGVGTFAYLDQDEDGNPIGLSFLFTAGNTPTTGTMTIILRHEPNKNATGVAQGNITNAGGDTDIEVTFNVALQ